jgi:hypothetical protein
MGASEQNAGDELARIRHDGMRNADGELVQGGCDPNISRQINRGGQCGVDSHRRGTAADRYSPIQQQRSHGLDRQFGSRMPFGEVCKVVWPGTSLARHWATFLPSCSVGGCPSSMPQLRGSMQAAGPDGDSLEEVGRRPTFRSRRNSRWVISQKNLTWCSAAAPTACSAGPDRARSQTRRCDQAGRMNETSAADTAGREGDALVARCPRSCARAWRPCSFHQTRPMSCVHGSTS